VASYKRFQRRRRIDHSRHRHAMSQVGDAVKIEIKDPPKD
jgi:hypothetical protein